MHELGYYRHVHYTLALMCANNRIIIFCSLLDIWGNVLLDIRENVVASLAILGSLLLELEEL